jgi:hypothetical protein
LLIEELLVASSLLAGTSSSSLLAGVGGLLVKELLAAGSLLAGVSGSGLLASMGGLVVSCPCRLDHVVEGPFPDHVRAPLGARAYP